MTCSKHISSIAPRIARECGGKDTTARYQPQRQDALLAIEGEPGEDPQIFAFRSAGQAVAARSIIELYLEGRFNPSGAEAPTDLGGDLGLASSDQAHVSHAITANPLDTNAFQHPDTIRKPAMTITQPQKNLPPDLFFDLGIDTSSYTSLEALRLPSPERTDSTELGKGTNPVAALRNIESQLISALRRMPYTDYSSERSNTWSFMKASASTNEDFVHISLTTNPPLLRVVFDNSGGAHNKFLEKLNMAIAEVSESPAGNLLSVDRLDQGPRKIFEIGVRSSKNKMARTGRSAAAQVKTNPDVKLDIGTDLIEI